MSRPLAAGVLAGLSLLAGPGLATGSPELGSSPAQPVCGLPEVVQARILAKAVQLMPPALGRQLQRHRQALLRGTAAGRATQPAGHHQGPQAGAGAAAGLADSLARITALLESRAAMSEVVREMGVAAHLVIDLTNPLRTAPGDEMAASLQPRFALYLDEMLPRFRIVFEGYTHPLLEAGDVPAFARHLADRSRTYLDDLVGSYRRFDAEADPALFDDRSVPFGVASLTFSRSVTDTARAWIHAWRNAHGDLQGLPYPLEPATVPEAEAREDGRP